MGNEQSMQASSRPANKLSKPKTNKFWNANLPNAKAFLSPSRGNSVATTGSRTKFQYPTVLSDAGEGEMEEPKKRKRMSLFGSRSSQKTKSSWRLDRGVKNYLAGKSAAHMPIHHWSKPARSRVKSMPPSPKSNSPDDLQPQINRPPARGQRMSLQHVPYHQHNPRLSLVAELPSPEPGLAEGSKRVPSYPQLNMAQQIPDSPRETEMPRYGPIRRRSLQQPGIATRKGSFAENDSRQSLPSQIQSLEELHRYYDPSKSSSSPLAELEAPDWNGDFTGARAKTPGDMDYGHTGAFKLGSLRITNGAASPAPSSDGAPGSRDGEADTEHMETPKRHNQHISGQLGNSSTPTTAPKAPWAVRSESPLRQAHNVETPPPRLTLDTKKPSPSLALFDFRETNNLFNTAQSPTKPLELAQEYMQDLELSMQDLELSPFSFDNSPRLTPRLEPTSKRTAIEDDLFSPEPDTPIEADRYARSFDSGYMGSFPKSAAVRDRREMPPKPLAKADSGYSSNVSLRSFKTREHAASPASPMESVSRVPSSTYSIASAAPSDFAIRAQRSLPALPRNEVLPPLVPAKQNVVDDRAEKTPSLSLPRKPILESHASPGILNYVRRRSLPNNHYAREESPGRSDISSSSNKSSRLRASRKLTKRPHSVQPQPQQVFTVQAFRSPNDFDISPPSIEAQRNLGHRVDGFPVACFPNTLAGTVGLRHTASKETLGTIFSVGSLEAKAELNAARLQGALPAVPMPDPIPENPTPKSDIYQRDTYQAPARKPLPEYSHSGRRMSFRRTFTARDSSPAPPRMSREQQQMDFEARITSFDAISSALGRGPYPVAMSSQPKPNPSAKLVNERAKSMTAEFEANAAARFSFARERNVNDTPRVTTIVGTTQSYESFANGDRNGSTLPSPNTLKARSRGNSRKYPPQAHSNRPSWGTTPAPGLAVPRTTGDEHRGSPRPQKTKSAPPVSIQTQGKMVPASTTPQIAPSRQESPPNHLPPPPPAKNFPPESQPEQAAYVSPADFWAQRRRSAGAALQTREGVETSRPNPSSMREATGLGIRRAETAGLPLQHQKSRPQPPATRMSMDGYAERLRTARGKSSTSVFDPAQYQHDGAQQDWVDYDHTFGETDSFQLKNNAAARAQQPEAEYYEADCADLSYQGFPEQFHQRNASTAEMIGLGRWDVGLAYSGYPPPPRESRLSSTDRRWAESIDNGQWGGESQSMVGNSNEYYSGVDFSDVPVLSQSMSLQA